MKKLLPGLGLILVLCGCASDSSDQTRVRESSELSTNANDRQLPPNINMKNTSIDRRN